MLLRVERGKGGQHGNAMLSEDEDAPRSEGFDAPSDETQPTGYIGINIFNPEDIRRLLNESSWTVGYDDESMASPSNEDAIWLRQLRRIGEDPRGPWRPLLIGNDAMLTKIADLDMCCPHFGKVTTLIRRAVKLSIATNTRIGFPPILLLGKPGIGKSHYAKMMAECFSTSYISLSINLLCERGRLGGLSTSWRGARIGELAKGLLKAETSSPIFFCDEIDKADNFGGGNVADVLLSAMEEQNSKAFVDEYLTFPLRLDHALFIATANDLSTIPPALLDRMFVFDIEPPNEAFAKAVIKSIYANVIEPYGSSIDVVLDQLVLERLASFNPRLAKQILCLALPILVEAGRYQMSLDDILEAEKFISAKRISNPIGFFGT